MIYGLYNSAAGMLVNEYRQNVIANNLANADTVGFKRDVAVFAERDTEHVSGTRKNNPSDPLREALTGGLWLGQTQTDFRPGPQQRTGRGLDAALDGPGFFLVQKGDQQLLTRDGRFVRDPLGFVTAVDGARVLQVNGQPLRVNPLGSEPTIDADGNVSQDGAVVGRLALVDVENYRTLEKTDGERFTAPDGFVQQAPAFVRGGYLEQPDVEPVIELTRMMETTRAYQLNAQMLTLQDQTLGRLINAVASS